VWFGLLSTEFNSWEALGQRLTEVALRLYRLQSFHPQAKKWLGLYLALNDPLPKLVFQGRCTPDLWLIRCRTAVHYMFIIPWYEVQPQSRTLKEIPPELTASGQSLSSYISRVRVLQIQHSQRKLVVRFFFGKVKDLDWDPIRIF
jgi:hypothetical protein